MQRFILLISLLLALTALLAACRAEEPAPTPLPAATAMPLAEPVATAAPLAPTAPAEPAAEATPPTEKLAMPDDAPLPEPAPTASPPARPFDPAALNLSLELVVDGLRRPLFATHAGDGSGRLFILEQAGVIRVLEDGQLRVFMDLQDRVGSSANEQGLLGLAFHPDFANNGRFFLYYTDRRGDTTISRFQVSADGSQGDPASEVLLLTEPQPAGNHNGGMIAFGPDGYLYAGLGDGGAANDRFGNGQNLATLLGSIIRIDVDSAETYSAPASNPFSGNAGARPEIWAYGLRNPWRFSFDRATGDLYIADVGQNQWEEVHFQPADSPGGENYGWPVMEGTHCFQSASCDQTGLELPVVEYPHSQGCSVTGGVVYRGEAQPALQGGYFYGDYCTGVIWALSRDAAGRWQKAEVLRSGLQISSFGETEEGEVLVIDHRGAVYRLVN